MNTIFSSGPRLIDEPTGDPKRQAIASLRGYAYQLYVSAIAWINLRKDERLYLEIAEDYAIAADNVLKGIQVKDTAQSGKVTINSEDVRDSIDAFVDLLERNPDYAVFFRFLTTSEIGTEKKLEHQVNGEAVLVYWRRAAAGADIAPLRAVLEKIAFSERVHFFINSRNDEELRRDLLRKIHWDCGQADLETVQTELGAAVIEYGFDRFRMPPNQGKTLVACILDAVLNTTLKSDTRRLVQADLFALFSEQTQISLPRDDVNSIMQSLATMLAGQQTLEIKGAQVLDLEMELPLPRLLARRPALIASAHACLIAASLAFLTGGTGFGKTLLARMLSREIGGDWYIVDFREANASESASRINTIIGRLASLRQAKGLILDDLNEVEAPEIMRSLARLFAMLQRRDLMCIITAYRDPSTKLLSSLGCPSSAHLKVSSFDKEEVGDIIALAGGNQNNWTECIYWASECGHPQLALALISGVSARGWCAVDLGELQQMQLSPKDIVAERDATRRQLIALVDEHSRQLLYRISLLIGRFKRDLALCLGDMKPQLFGAGEKLDVLIGPWIDQESRGELRISPLISNIGQTQLTTGEQQNIHRVAAKWLMRDNSINLSEVNSLFMHALFGKAEKEMFGLATAVLSTMDERRAEVAECFFSLRAHRTDKVIFPSKLQISILLRIAQLLLVAESKDHSSVVAVWVALLIEIEQVSGPLHGLNEIMAYSLALNNMALAGKLPNWLGILIKFKNILESDTTRSLGLTLNIKSNARGHDISIIGVLFCNQLMGVKSTTQLLDIFLQLDELNLDDRESLFAGVVDFPSDFLSIINNAWMREKDSAEIDWSTAAARYLRMGELAKKWGNRILAIRCHIARAVMFDEYGKDGKSALEALDYAVLINGTDPLFSRARAKIHYRQKDHANALLAFEASRDYFAVDDPIERTFMHREAGISAAELGSWRDARQWLLSAANAAKNPNFPIMLPMEIGLIADAAIAAYKCGEIDAALDELCVALTRLNELDPQASLKAKYCHSVVRHSLLWLVGQARGEVFEVDGEPVVMKPGMCSNPEPLDAIWAHEIAPIAVGWYLLAQAEIVYKPTEEVYTRLRSRLAGRSIPSCEITAQRFFIEDAICRSDSRAFQFFLNSWVAALIYIHKNHELLILEKMQNPKFFVIPPLTQQEIKIEPVKSEIERTILVFGGFAALSGNTKILNELGGQYRNMPVDFDQYPLFGMMINGVEKPKTFEEGIAQAIFDIANNKILKVEVLFRAGIRILQLIKQASLGKILAPLLHDWTKQTWGRVITEQKFSLKLPPINVPNIAEALNSDVIGPKYLAKVLLTASDAVSVKIDGGIRDFLEAANT